MAGFEIRLSSAAIKNIVIHKIQEDFAFVVGGQSYQFPRIVAAFWSPRVCLSHSVDPSIAEYIVQNLDLTDQFYLFMSLGSGSTIPVTEDSLDFFLSLSRELGNSDLYISLLEHFGSDFICSQLQDSTTLDLLSDDLIGRISSKCYELIGPELEEIPVAVLFHVLSHRLLVISSEDDLFSYISLRICLDPEYLALLQFVHFEYLSKKHISYFLSTIPHSIDCRLWESIARRLISRVAIEFPLKEARSLEGIISHLTQKHGGNVHDKGIVTVTSKSVVSGDAWNAQRNVVDLASRSYFWSADGPGQWICWDFHEMRFCPTQYTIKSGYPYLKSWMVESSLDGEAWTEIDSRTDNGQLAESPNRASFDISYSAECRFIRLSQTGKNHGGRNNLVIRAFDVFGTVLC
jgi:hypothetical protein